MSGSAEVDAYVAALPEKQRPAMQRLREIVTGAAPTAIEAIAYKMPALRLGDKFFMSYDAYKTHFSLFPSTDRMIGLLGDELTPHLSGKGTLRFAADEPLPADLIRRIVEIRLAEFLEPR
ncbi:MAG: DUF1801 domain-containing protein [Chloroflexota bacterium]